MLAAPTTTLTAQDQVQTQSLAEPDTFDGFDRSGHGVAQRRRAAIIGTGGVQRKVAQRELEVTASPGTVGEESARKLERVANTLNSMPFEQSMEISLKTESGEKGAPPLRSKLAGEDEATTTIYLQTEFVENSAFDQILQACMNTLGEVIFKKKQDPAEVDQLDKETVLNAGDRRNQQFEKESSRSEADSPPDFPKAEFFAIVSDYLLPKAYAETMKVLGDDNLDAQVVFQRTRLRMGSLLGEFIEQNQSSHGWLRQLKGGVFDSMTLKAKILALLRNPQQSSAKTKSVK